MVKRIENYIFTAYEDLTIDKENNKSYHLISIIVFNENNTYTEKFLYFDGSIDTFKHMSDIQLVRVMDKLIKKDNHSKFSLQLETTYTVY